MSCERDEVAPDLAVARGQAAPSTDPLRVDRIALREYGAAHAHRRKADRELLREVRAGDGEARQGIAREVAEATARAERVRLSVRAPGVARDLVLPDPARQGRRVHDRAVSGLGEVVLREGAVEVRF